MHHSLIETSLVGLATDGASVMPGVNKSVAARFKRLVPTVVTTHSMAHRLQLLTEKAANRCPAITKYIGVLNTFAKALKFSPKLCRILESSKELYGEDACKVRQVFFTRWLLFVDSVQAIASCLASVISATYAAAAERLADGQAVLLGCARQMATYKFMYLTAFLSDAVGIIAILNKTLQKDALTYATVKPHIDTTVIELQSLLTADGPYLAAMKEHLPADVGEFEYKGHQIKDSQRDRQKTQQTVHLFIEEMVTRLQSVFPDAGIMDALTLFDPSLLPRNMAEEALIGYGYFEMNEIATRLEWTAMRGLLLQAATSSMSF